MKKISFLAILFSVLISSIRPIPTITTSSSDLIIDSNGACSWTSTTLDCSNFTSFTDLGLSALDFTNYTFDQITIKPLNKIVFDSQTAEFTHLRLNSNCSINLENFSGFEIFGSPFTSPQQTTFIKITNSNIVFYNEGTEVDEALCDEINANDLYVTLFDTAGQVQLDVATESSLSFCPAALKNTNINKFVLSSVSNEKFFIMPIATSTRESDLNSNITNFDISGSFRLTSGLLNPDMLAKTQSITVYDSSLDGGDEDLFRGRFEFLNFLELSLRNMDEFIESGDNDWMSYLNEGYTRTGRQFILTLIDVNKLATFEEKNFCAFKNFPHENKVFPVS